MITDIFMILLQAASGSVLVFATVMILRKVLKSRLSPPGRLWLWLPLLMRLALPVTFQVDIGLMPVSALQPYEFSAFADRPVSSMPSAEMDETDFEVRPAEEKNNETEGDSWDPVLGMNFFVGIWGTGVVISAFICIREYSLLRHICSRQGKAPEPAFARLLEENCKKLNIRKKIHWCILDNIHSPALLFPNTILLPGSCHVPAEYMQLGILHELLHFRRGDQFLSFIVLLLRIVYWFNPVIWAAARLIREDIETACDASVMNFIGKTNRDTYAYAVLAFTGRAKQHSAAVTFGAVRKETEKRIKELYIERKPKTLHHFWEITAVLILVTVLLLSACGRPGNSDLSLAVPSAQGSPENASESFAATPYLAPLSVRESRANVQLDAVVHVPAGAAAVTAESVLREFTGEELRSFIEALTQKKDLQLYREIQMPQSWWEE